MPIADGVTTTGNVKPLICDSNGYLLIKYGGVNMPVGYDYIIVKDGTTYYALDGSTGEPISTDTDAAVVIQAAVGLLPATGGSIRIMGGDFYLNSGITIAASASVSIIGNGGGMYTIGTTRLFANAVIAGAMINFNSSDDVNMSNGHMLCDIVLFGDNKATTGVQFTGVYFSRVERVNIESCTNGIYYKGGGNNTFTLVSVRVCDYGLRLANSPVLDENPFESCFRNCRFQDNNEYAVYASYPDAAAESLKFRFCDCAFESGVKKGVYLYNATFVVFDHCMFESNNTSHAATTDDLHISCFTQRENMITLKDCNFIGTDVTYSINISSSNNVQIINTRTDDSILFDYCDYVSASALICLGTMTLADESTGAFIACGLTNTTINNTADHMSFLSCHFVNPVTDNGVSTEFYNCA